MDMDDETKRKIREALDGDSNSTMLRLEPIILDSRDPEALSAIFVKMLHDIHLDTRNQLTVAEHFVGMLLASGIKPDADDDAAYKAIEGAMKEAKKMFKLYRNKKDQYEAKIRNQQEIDAKQNAPASMTMQ